MLLQQTDRHRGPVTEIKGDSFLCFLLRCNLQPELRELFVAAIAVFNVLQSSFGLFVTG